MGSCNVTVDSIVRYYQEKISKTGVGSQISKVVRNIEKNKGVPLDLILFSLKYAVGNQIRIKGPYSLYYLVDDDRIKRTWRKIKDDEAAREMNHYLFVSPVDPIDNDFYYKPEKFRGFGEILDGH